MRLENLRLIGMLAIVSATLAVAGCGENSPGPGTVGSPPEPAAKPASAAGEHSGWWCTEHGVPEEECSLCDAKAAEQFKAKGDWCEEHNRAESQCFICDPARAEKSAALYEAKYGTKPPKPGEQ